MGLSPPGGLFVVMFGAGLATGLLRFPAPVGVVVVLGGLALALRPHARLLVIAGLVGLGVGWTARRAAQGECAARLPAGSQRVTVQTLEPGRRGRTRVRPYSVRCRGGVTALLPPEVTPPPGTVLEVQARWRPRPGPGGRPGGVLIIRQAEPGDVPGPVGLRLGAGARLSARAEQLFGARAPLVEALVLGWRADLDPALRDRFARAGLAHLLAISGLHVGILAGWAAALLRLAGRSATIAARAAGVGALAYAAFLGWPAPATRAAVLLLLLTFGMSRQRRIRPAALLGVCALAVLLVDPWAVVSVGAWLSVAAVWGVMRAVRAAERSGFRGNPARAVAAAIGATFATAPITAYVFGSVPLAGIVLNLIAIPLAAVAVPGVMAALVTAPVVPSLAAALAGGAGLVLAALERLAEAASALPGVTVLQIPGPNAALPWVLILGLFWWTTDPRLPGLHAARRGLGVVTLLLWIGLAWPGAGRHRLGPTRPGLTLHLLDVGQGDAAALRTPGGAWVLVDAGPVGREVESPTRFLEARSGGRLALLVASHPHADHIGGAGLVLDRLLVEAVAEPAAPVADSGYLALLDRVAEAGSAWIPARRGWSWIRDGVRFTALHPDTGWAGWGEDPNEDSLVLLVEFGRFRALFTGDAGRPVEAVLAGQVGRVDLLKVGHHGSRTATGPGWVAELRPRLAVISVGPNRYGHPAPEVLDRFAAERIPVWRTDRNGPLTVWTDGVRMTIRGRGTREEISLAPAAEAGGGSHGGPGPPSARR